jgi:hypothetical protein
MPWFMNNRTIMCEIIRAYLLPPLLPPLLDPTDLELFPEDLLTELLRLPEEPELYDLEGVE